MNDYKVLMRMTYYASLKPKQFLEEWDKVMDWLNPNRQIDPVIEREPTEAMCSICREVLPVEKFRFVTKTRRGTKCKRCEYLDYLNWKKAQKEMRK